MKSTTRFALLFLFALTLGVGQFWASPAQAQSSFFTSRGCVNCHAAPTAATCNGCHHHGNSNLKAVTNKTSYAPGETVSATLSGGSKTGWIRAVLYDQNNAQIAISNGTASGMGSSTTFPATLTAPAPSTPGTYTWKMAYFGNQDGSGTGDVHGEKTVTLAAFTVAAATAAPTVSSISPASMVQGATNSTLTINGANLTGATLAFSGSGITTGAATVSATAITVPVTVAASATTGARNLTVTTPGGSASSAFSVTAAPVPVPVPVPDPVVTAPTLTLSMLADGSYTKNITLNVSGTASDSEGIKSVTVNGAPATVNPDGTFTSALTLAVGSNPVTVVATDTVNTQTTASRTINYDPAAPVLTVADPADNSTTTQSFVTLSGTVNENSTVTVRNNAGSPQSATINGNGFTATVNLVSGLNTIDIDATDLAGNTANAKRTVTYDNAGATVALAVTSPDRDITTNKRYLVLKGQATDAIGKAKVAITMNGRTYRPHVSRTGTFQQRLVFSQTYAERTAERRNPAASSSKLYTITISATDAAGNNGIVTRNVIYNSRYESDDDD